jgi:hypothetical protein
MTNNASDMELFTACQAEAKEPPINLNAVDPSPFMPPPMGIRSSVLKMSDLKVREAWLRAYQKEIKTLIDAKIFALDKPKDGEPVIPTMEGDSWSPTAPFRSLKMFLADAARNKCRVHQLDFVGAFLQANVRGRIFVSLPKVYLWRYLAGIQRLLCKTSEINQEHVRNDLLWKILVLRLEGMATCGGIYSSIKSQSMLLL